MTHSTHHLIESITQTHGVEVAPVERGFEIKLSGGTARLGVVQESNEFSVYADEWHTHCADEADLEKLLRGLFDGAIQVSVKYRGNFPVAYRIVHIEGKKTRLIERGGSLLAPFWRKKRYAVITYTGGKREARNV